jgi:hypothetical protein
MASGDIDTGNLELSPVIACGSSKSASYNTERFSLIFHPSSLKDFISQFELSPFHVDWGKEIRAVQYRPL